MAFHVHTEEQRELIDLVRKFGESEIRPHAADWDKKGECPLNVIRAGLEMGLQCLDQPEEYGGAGLGTKTACMVFEELAKSDAGVTCAFSVTGTAAVPVMKYGTEEQKQLCADILFRRGGLGSFCLTEPGSGSDSGASRMTAVRQGDSYVLNGTKCFITNGGYAELYFVIASTDRSKGNKGLSGFLVTRDTPGLTVGKEEDKCGFRTSNTVELVFEDVVVPASCRVGREGDGFKQAMAALDHGRPYIGAVALGVGQRALEEAIAYSKVRSQFGQPICNNQAIRFMLADMEMRLESARCLVYHAAELIDQHLPVTMNGSIAKCCATDAAMQVALDAVQILGGYGYMREYPVEKLMRDAKIFQIVEGTNQIQRVVISGQLLK